MTADARVLPGDHPCVDTVATVGATLDAAAVTGQAAVLPAELYGGEPRVRVLLIEDEVRLAAQLQQALTDEGFTVEVAHDGQSGLWAALERPVDVIVCDIMLPRLNGYDVLRRLRGQDMWTPVLMLTAKDGEYDQADAFELGADDYLTKPFSLVVLVARLKALLRRTGAPAGSSTLTVGDLRLDGAGKRVFCADAEIAVTPREFGLLEYLMQRAGQVVSKQEILEAVWDGHYDGDPNVVEVYVGYLRKKLDPPLGRRSIVTVRGLGYRLDNDPGPART